MSETFPHPIRAVLFDHDDTLVDTINPKWEQHKYVAKQYYGKDLSDEEIRAHWGKPLPSLMMVLYGTNDVDRAMSLNTACHEAYPKTLLTGTKSTLESLQAAALGIGVITATTRYSFNYDVTALGIGHLFDYTQTAEATEHHKPDHRVFEPALMWLAKMKIKPVEVIYVGDGLHDMLAARGAGFHFVGVETGLVNADEFHNSGAASIPSVVDLPAYLGIA